jgi:hypothetical protein
VAHRHEIADSSRKLSDLQAKAAAWDSAKPFSDWHGAHKTDSNRCLVNLFDAVGLSRRLGNRAINDYIGHDDLELQPWSDMSGQLMDRLLDKLSFEEMFDRQGRIPDAFPDTFQWVFEDPKDPEKPWDSFSSWLTRGEGVYWITGKAGSGKSTMMRMLLSSPRTRQLLCEWCQSNSIIVSSFFFWNSGSALQMSEEGLLRSLLSQVLEEILKDPSEQLLRKLEAFCLILQPGDTMRLKDLKQLLRIVVEENDQPLRYFFIIDGLDEVEGDKASLVALVHTLGTYPHIKICVSSRPWVVFEDGFCQQPSLMLQFLTYSDIMRYVREKLTGQPAFRELAWGFPKIAEDLLEDVTAKASGVFLWVILAVDSLIKGLADGDRIEDLKCRLDDIPEELEELFGKMLHGLQGRYFVNAARIFQMHRAAKEPGLEFSRGFSLLALALAEELTLASASKWAFKPFTDKELLMRSITMKRRLSSRCNGLLEIEDPRRKNGNIWNARDLDRLITDAGSGDPSVLPTLHAYGRALAHTTVQYLHRTVKDYLEAPEIWLKIEEAASSDRRLDHRTSLCLVHMVFWKTWTLNVSEDDDALQTSGVTFKSMLEQAFRSALTLARKPQIEVLDAIGRSLFPGNTVFSVWNRLDITCPPDNFLSVAVHCNLVEYVDEKLAYSSPKVSVRQYSRLLQVAASKEAELVSIHRRHDTSLEDEESDSDDPNGDHDEEGGEHDEDKESNGRNADDDCWVGYRYPGSPDLEMVELLLRHGADPDRAVDGLSCRELVKRRLSMLLDSSPEYRYRRYILSKMIGIFDRGGEERTKAA